MFKYQMRDDKEDTRKLRLIPVADAGITFKAQEWEQRKRCSLPSSHAPLPLPPRFRFRAGTPLAGASQCDRGADE
jgi:hypothetical protein